MCGEPKSDLISMKMVTKNSDHDDSYDEKSEQLPASLKCVQNEAAYSYPHNPPQTMLSDSTTSNVVLTPNSPQSTDDTKLEKPPTVIEPLYHAFGTNENGKEKTSVDVVLLDSTDKKPLVLTSSSSSNKSDAAVLCVRSDQWQCKTCTVLNHMHLAYCEVCGVNKPSASECAQSDDVSQIPDVHVLNDREIALQIYQQEEQQQRLQSDIKIECDRCGTMVSFKLYREHLQSHEQQDKQMLLQSHNVDLVAQVSELEKKLMVMQQTHTEQKTQYTYPEWWDMESAQQAKYGSEVLLDIDLESENGRRIVQLFNQTANNRVVKIAGVMNQYLYDKWWNERQSLEKHIGAEKLNQRELFHGTKSADVMQFVMREGFRAEFNTSYACGQGTYFARDAGYSVGYSAPQNDGAKAMLLCAVICGESHKGDNTITLKTWPKKSNSFIYDSLVNATENPSIFVIHENARIYPMFVLHFQ